MTTTTLLPPSRAEAAPLSPAATAPLQRPIRVAFIDHTARLGGGEIALLNLVTALDRALVDPIVILFSEGPLADACRDRHIEVKIVPLGVALLDARKDSLGIGSVMKLRSVLSAASHIRKVASAIRAAHADLVHTNSLKADIIGGIAGRLARRPVIWHIRDRIADDYLPRSVAALFRRLGRIIPHFIIANSSATLSTLRLPAKAQQAVVPSGIRSFSQIVHDGTIADAQQSHANAAFPLIGLVGRIAPWKGQHIFLRAAAFLHQRFPNARFLIVGSPLFGEHAYEKEIRALSTSLGLDDVVTFAGFRDDIPAVMRSLTIAVHASTVGEPFGQVVIEAMAAARPVVATNGGGIPEIIDDGISGTLVPMGDADAMAAALASLLLDPQRASAMGQSGRNRVLSQFTIQHTARKMEAIYQSLLTRRRTP